MKNLRVCLFLSLLFSFIFLTACSPVLKEETHVGEVPNESIDRTFEINLKSSTNCENVIVLFGASLAEVENSINNNLQNYNSTILYARLNNLAGIFCEKNNGFWAISEWARQELFFDDAWIYEDNITLFLDTNTDLYTFTSSENNFYAYKNIEYCFCYNTNSETNIKYTIAVFNNNLLYNLTVFDKDFNSINLDKIGLENRFLASNVIYYKITFTESQNVSIITANDSMYTTSFTSGRSQDRPQNVDLVKGVVYALRINITGGSVKFQILQTACECIKFFDKNSNTYTIEQNSDNIIMIKPEGEYIFYLRCVQESGEYMIDIHSGSSFIIE